ncbi:MAG: virulence RhuM family protein [Bacteroidales bacterium]|nr:virulence RhuM family protein [Bacteroidales bacterium]
MNKGEIILYQPDDTISLEVRIEDETVWLNRQQMAILFGRDVKTIGKHINNALKEELENFSVVANFATTARDGKTYKVDYYNLDMILSVGYRVKSQKGIEFRKWASAVLKDYILRGYAINRRIEQLENKVEEHDKQIAFFVRTSLPPVQGIFYDGQIFDAYVFASELIRSAKSSITLIDNYVDESVLLLLLKRDAGVAAKIITRQITQGLAADMARHNQQYPPLVVTESPRFHDRFLIIDDAVYHIGASSKDLGKKLFAFSKMEIPVEWLEP